MKKILFTLVSALLCAAMLLGASACMKNDDKTDDDNKSDAAETDYVTLGDYLGIEYTPTSPAEVTDSDVEASVKSSLSSYATEEKITDRAVKSGDIANIDYVGKVDGVEFSGGSYQGYDLEIGSGSFIPGFEDGLIGANIGQTLDVKATFPDPYPNDPDLAGKEAVFTVTVNSITEKKYPELTDDFVKEYFGYDNAQEYRDALKKNLTETAQENSSTTDKNAILKIAVDNATVNSYPQDKLDDIYNKYQELYEQQATSYGYDSLEAYLKAYGVSVDEFEKQIKEYAQSMLKSDLVFEAIAKKEGLEVTDEMLENAKKTYLSKLGYDNEADFEKKYNTLFDDYYAKNYALYTGYTLEYEVLISNAQQFVIDNAKAA